MSKINRAITGKEYAEDQIDFLEKEGFIWPNYGSKLEYSEENVYVQLQNSAFYVRISDENNDHDEKASEHISFNIENFFDKYNELCDWIIKNK